MRQQTPFEYRASEVQRALEHLRSCEDTQREWESELEKARANTESARLALDEQRTQLFDEYPELLPAAAQTPSQGGSSSEWRPPGGLEFGEQDDTLPPDLEFTET